MDYKFWRELRNKENKTDEEKLLLEMKNSLSLVCEILVDYDKCHYTEERALEKIRDGIHQVINKM